MCCNRLLCVWCVVVCRVLQYVAVCDVRVCCSVSQCVATGVCMVQYVTLCCSVLQCFVICCSVYRMLSHIHFRMSTIEYGEYVCCSVLQCVAACVVVCVAVCCSMLQFVAV